jgi:protein phosphatase
MRETLRTSALDDVPQKLIDLANARGGDDNITVIVVQIDETT